MKLIANWKKAWRMLSVQAMTLAGAVQGGWLFIPSDMRSSIPESTVQMVTLSLLGLGVVGRLVDQPKTK